MTSRSHNTARRVAARAVPAFLVAGLGLSLQAVPAMAVEAQSAPAIEQQATGEGAVLVTKNDDSTLTLSTLQAALQNGYESRYYTIKLQSDITETINVAANPDYDVDNPDPYYYTYEIIMDGHTIQGAADDAPAITNRGKLRFWSSGFDEKKPGNKGKLLSDDGTADGVVIENYDNGDIEVHNNDVVGTMKNNGFLSFYGDCKVSGTVVNDESTGTGPAYVHFDGGDYTDLTIDNEADDWHVTAVAGTFKQNPIKWLSATSVAKKNGDGTWTVIDLDDDKLEAGTYHIDPDSSKGYPLVTEDNIKDGLHVSRIDDSTYVVEPDTFANGTVAYIESADGTMSQFTSLEAALAAAESGDTVCLAKNIKTNSPITLRSDVNIDGKGHNLTYTGTADIDAFLTIADANYGPVIQINYLNVYTNQHCRVAMLCKDNARQVQLKQVHLEDSDDYALEVDSADVYLEDCALWPGSEADEYKVIGAIHFLKGGYLWSSLCTNDVQIGNVPLVYIEPEDLEKIRQDANAEGRAQLYTAKQTARWLDSNGSLNANIRYWSTDGHAEDRPMPGGDSRIEDAYIVSSDHGTVSAESVNPSMPSKLTITPDAGYQVSDITIKNIYGYDIDLTASISGEQSFIMPEGGVNIWVTYEKTGTPTPDPDPTPTPKPDPVEDIEIPETEGGEVEVEPVEAGETATVVAEPNAGQEVRDVIVTDPEGNEIDVTVDKDGNYTFEMPEGGATVEVVFGCDGGDLCASHSFGDVTHDDWFHDTVDWAVDEGIFHGYDDGTFGPNDTLTREQAATVMYNYFGGTTGSGSAGMSDVGNDWYTDAVNWAVENGVMTGYSGTDKFGIGDALSREQFCSVIAKAMGADLEGADLSVLDRFTDAGSVSDWAKPAVAWAVENGLMNGVENADGTRSLQGVRDMTRAEMAAMMKNAVDAGVLTK